MTRIGILSDSHGRAAITQRAAKLLVERGAEVLVHLGDICHESVIAAMLHGPPVRVVFGNCDCDAGSLTRYATHLGVTVDDPLGRLVIAGKTVLFTHGHEQFRMHFAVRERADYLLHGHTHERRDDRTGNTRIINPGALYRAPTHTVALLDVATDGLEFFEIE